VYKKKTQANRFYSDEVRETCQPGFANRKFTQRNNPNTDIDLLDKS